jgi:hypothetical protein
MTTPRPYVVLSWLVAAAVVSAAGYNAAHSAGPGSDAYLRWQEARYMLRGVDPIDVATEAAPPAEDIGPLTALAGYPPWSYVFSILFLPPAPWPIAFGCFLTWHVPALAAMAYVGWEVGARLAPLDPGLRRVTAAAGLVTGSIPVCLYYGNYGVVVYGMLIAAFAADRSGWSVLAGFCWGLAMIKPQVAILYGVVFLVRRSWMALTVGGLVIAAASIVASGLIGKSPLVLLREIAEQGSRHLGGVTGGFQGAQELLLYVGITPTGIPLIGLIVGAVLVGLLSRWPRAAALASVLSVPGVVVPLVMHHRTHDLVIQTPLVVFLTVDVITATRLRSAGRVFLDVALLVLIVVPIPYRFTRDLPMSHVPIRLAAAVALWRVWPLARAAGRSAGDSCPTH